MVDAITSQAAEVARLCCRAGAPELIAGYVKAGTPVAAVTADLIRLMEIRNIVTEAGKANAAIDPRLAMTLFQRGMDAKAARAHVAALPVIKRAEPTATSDPFNFRRPSEAQP